MHLPISTRIALWMFLLGGACKMHAQSGHGDVAVTFVGERSLKANTGQNFWMEGGSAEVGFRLVRGLGVAVDCTGAHTDSIGSSGLPLNLFVFTGGPRYRWRAGGRVSIYGEGLFGVAHGSDSLFPSGTGATPTANSFAFQVNGGVDYKVREHFAVRMLDVGYLRTTLPNGTNGVQNTLRLGAGVVWRF